MRGKNLQLKLLRLCLGVRGERRKGLWGERRERVVSFSPFMGEKI